MIFVTGATGFLGRALVEQLLIKGATDIRALARAGANTNRLSQLVDQYGADRLAIVRGDLSSAEAARTAMDSADTVYHLAAGLTGSAADIFVNSVVTSRNLLEAVVARQDRPRVLLVSSMGVYGTAVIPRGQLVDENTPLEPHPEKRDLYSQAKLRQERLFWEYRERSPFPLVVVRPGVIYGPGGVAMSSRVGINFPGVFLYLGGKNRLPLTYVDNCAEAMIVAANQPAPDGSVVNIVDNDLPTCADYLRQYQRDVARLRTVRVPYPALQAISWLSERYHHWSKGQLPSVFTPYRSKTSWAGNQFDNSRLRALGWTQTVSTQEGLKRTFAAISARS